MVWLVLMLFGIWIAIACLLGLAIGAWFNRQDRRACDNRPRPNLRKVL